MWRITMFTIRLKNNLFRKKISSGFTFLFSSGHIVVASIKKSSSIMAIRDKGIYPATSG